jgi:Tlde1 domain
LVQLGVRAIPFGIVAMLLGFVLKSAGTQAGPAEPGLLSPRVSVFGTIHLELFRLSAPLGSGSPGDRIRLASLEPVVGFFDAPANGAPMLTDTSASACRNASLDERFAALDDRPASFDHFASANDCLASFDERFVSAMPVLASSLRLPPDRDVQNRRADAPPKSIVAKAHLGLGQARKEVPPHEDDGRTAIYDITARTVYLPSGRRLEAHSGFGDLMDNPRHVHVRMQGATPPNVYNLTLRERPFHGVRAIRLNPVDGSKMYGRAGILAHSYMLGPNGQSNGCVSFSDYPEFLNAFLRGEVTRLVVVERLESPPGKFAAGQLPDRGRDELKADRSFQYAAASY